MVFLSGLLSFVIFYVEYVFSSEGHLFLMVGIAQLVESRIVIPVVVGSSPISHPTNSKGSTLRATAFSFFRHPPYLTPVQPVLTVQFDILQSIERFS